MNDRVSVLGTRVTATTFVGAQVLLSTLVHESRGCYVSPANVYSIMLAYDDPAYQAVINEAAFVTTDGVPVVWALRGLGFEAQRVHNDDLFLTCCSRYPEWRHFLVGGREGQPEEVAAEMRRRFPGITIAGTHPTPCRPVSPGETQLIVEKIRTSNPDVVWVGMGTPAQDFWMASAAAACNSVMVGCGSLFDLLTGRTLAAPAWVKKSGLQWLFRLVQEPRRLAFRYLYYNPRFVVAFSGQWLRHRMSPRPPRSAG